MHIIEPKDIKNRQIARSVKKQRVRHRFLVMFLIVLIGSYGYIAYRWPLSSVKGQPIPILPTVGSSPQIAWPTTGQAAVGANGYGLLDTSGNENPVPTASVAKVITALAIMKQKPFQAGAQGATLTLDATDIGYYDYYSSNDGSVVYVLNGEQITEYQALQALLLPSANNMADTLVRWAFGSQAAYVKYATDMVKSLGMTKTNVADASGFSSATTSTARDLVVLGIAAMDNTVIANIVGQTSAIIPVAGTIQNVNTMLGQNGIIGIKTGNTDAAGGCYLFASSHLFDNGIKVTTVGAIMGAPSLTQAMNSSVTLLDSTYKGFDDIQVARSGQKVGVYTYPWGKSTDAVLPENLSVFGWTGSTLRPKVTLTDTNDLYVKGARVGTAYIKTGSQQATVPVVTADTIIAPPWTWRLLRPIN